MAKKFATLAVLAVLSCSSYAVDGTVTVSGTVTNTTCTVTPSSTTVTLPTVSKTSLGSIGATAGTTAWSVAVSACSGASTMTTYFEPASTTNGNGRLLNSGTATGVDVQMLTSAFGVINLAAGAGSQGVSSTAVVSNAATQSFYIRYYATSASVTAGTFVGGFTFTMIYT